MLRKAWLSRNVMVLGMVSLLTDTASEMIMSILPMFLMSVLHTGALALGWIEGLADFVASLMKLLSGRWADRLQQYRIFVVVGYGLASAIRPLVALATASWHVLLVRVTDRVGKGIRSSPRDALIANSVPASQRGMAFGFHRAMDHAGAILGPLIAVLCLSVWPNGFRAIFWLAAIPSGLVLLVLFFGLRNTTSDRSAAPGVDSLRTAPPPRSLRRNLARFLVPLGVFTLGNSSDLFLLYQAGAVDTPLYGLPLLWMAFHVVKAVTSLAGGWMSDRMGRRKVILVGWVVYALVYAAFAFAASPAAVLLLFLVYGTYHGLTEGAEKALISELAPAGSQGTAFGWYHLTVGLLTLPASLLFGLLWDLCGSQIAFLVGAGLAAMGMILLYLMLPDKAQESGQSCSI